MIPEKKKPRQKYESNADLDRQKEVEQFLASALSVNVVRMPDVSYGLDCYGVSKTPDEDGFHSIKWYAEIKCRDHTEATFKTLFISALKFERGYGLSMSTGVPFYIVVRFANGKIFCHTYSHEKEYRVTLGGRTDRGDAADMEPVVHIPISEFHEICGPVEIKW
jgi:hypothetical protein